MAPALPDPDAALVPLAAQPDGVPWPAADWPEGDPDPAHTAKLDALVAAIHTRPEEYGTTYATVVVHHGRLISERYGGAIPHWDGPDEQVDAGTRLLSWSMAKSVLHFAVGPLVDAGRLALDGPAPVPEWADPTDPRHLITLDQLLCMRDGLDFLEDYVDETRSDVITMLFGTGQADVAHFGADRPLAHAPGAFFNYSSGTSNIVSGIVAREVGTGPEYLRYLNDTLFEPIGMASAEPRFDDAGTFIGSSYVYATARDFARFGLLALRDGIWDGRRVVPPGWVDHGRRPRSVDAEDGQLHGAHWWVVSDDLGTFRASGYEGQAILVCPALDLVVVRLGRSTRDQYDALTTWRRQVVNAFR